MPAVFWSGIFIPFLLLIVISFLKWSAKKRGFWESTADLGWDLIILSVGVTGVLFSDKHIQEPYADLPINIGIIVLSWNFFLLLVLAEIQRRNTPDPRDINRRNIEIGRGFALCCVFLGFLALSTTSAVTLPTTVRGILCGIVPCG